MFVSHALNKSLFGWCGDGSTRPLPRNGGAEELHRGQQSGPTPGLDQRSKMEEVVPKMAHHKFVIVWFSFTGKIYINFVVQQ